jgi:hypothetical protein
MLTGRSRGYDRASISDNNHMTINKRAVLIICLFACLIFPGTSRDESRNSQEYALKAAFLYNFILFTEWPATAGSTLKVCIYGRDPFGDNLDKLRGKNAHTRTVTIHRTNRLSDLKDCQVVFIAPSAIGQLSEIHETLRGRPVLTVSDSHIATLGVAINMFTEQNKVTFEINLPAARNAGLSISSKLLKLAGEVYQ